MVAASSVVLFAAFAAAGPTEILQFTGESCPACVSMEPVVQQLQQAGVPIRKIDVHQHTDIARQYGITAIPAFVLVSDGREVDRIVGGTSAADLHQLYLRMAPPTSGGPTATGPAALGPITRGQAPASLLASAAQAVRQATGLPSPQQDPIAGEMVRSAEPPASKRVAAIPASASPRREPGLTRNAPPAAGNPHAMALAATVRIKVMDSQGRAFGTGTIVDVHEDEALVLTCGHIFRESQGKGRILCDLFVPGAQSDIEAKLISYDLRRDVGLLSLRPGVPVTAAPVGGTGHVARNGDPVFAMGCNQGADPTVIENRVLAVNRYNGPPNLVVGGRPIDGRSGGGLFAANGTLIGVCNAADPELDEGLYAALGNIHSELDKSGLAFVYRRPANVPGHQSAATMPSPTPTDRAGLVSVPAGNRAAATLPADAVPPSAIAQSAGATPEFVYIRWTQGSEDQVYMLERPSDEFLQSLSREINRRGPHVPTASRPQGR